MNNPHRPSQPLRLSQLLSNSESRPSETRLSRYDRSSKIPRSMNRNGSLDRISGVHMMDNLPSSATRSISKPMRNRSADSVRQTMIYHRSKSDSVQRVGQKRARSISTVLPRETPQNKVSVMRNYLTTPMSSMSNQGRPSHQRTPSNERPRSVIDMLERMITQPMSKDARPHTDLTVLKEKYNEIIEKLRSYPPTSALIPPGAVPLKPISMNLFINITNALLSELCGPSNAVNAKNYSEKIPEIAAKLMYNGVMSKSWLISVYASHTYPHMMAFFGYLLDLVEINSCIKENMSLDTLYGSNENANILIQRYLYYQESWTQYQDEDFQDFELIADKYIENYKEIRGFSDNTKEFLNNKLNETRRANEHAISELDKVQEKEKHVHEELNILRSRAEQLKEMEKDLRSQTIATIADCAELENSLQCSTNSIKELENKLEQLQLQLKNQKMSIKDRDDILKEIDYLKECYNSKVECLSDMENVSFEKDIELAKAQKEALKGCAIVNKSLVRVGLAAGKDLTGYALNERDLLKDTTETKQRTIQAFENLKEEAERRLQTACLQKDSKISQTLELHNKIEMAKELRDALKIDLIDKQKGNDELKMNLNQIKEQLSVKCRNRNELKQRNQNALEKYKDAEKQLNHWKEQQVKWEEQICQLKKRKESAKMVYEKQAEEIILKYIEMAKSTIPDVRKLQK